MPSKPSQQQPALDLKSLRALTPKDYPYQLEYRTRWSDNDQYGHLNNTIYPQLIDSIINTYLIQHCGLSPSSSPSPPSPSSTSAPPTQPPRATQIGLVLTSHCTYLSSTSFPSTLLCGMRVVKIGNSSVSYEVGIFGPPTSSDNPSLLESEEKNWAIKAVGGFTHVFVDKHTRRPVPAGMEEGVRRGLEMILITARSVEEKEKARL